MASKSKRAARRHIQEVPLPDSLQAGFDDIQQTTASFHELDVRDGLSEPVRKKKR